MQKNSRGFAPDRACKQGLAARLRIHVGPKDGIDPRLIPARQAEQQADAKAPFQLSDGLGDSGLSDVEQSRGAGERAGFDDPDEYLHRCQPIHGHSSKERLLSP